MDIKLVKNLLGKIVYYDTGQINFDGCTIKDFIFTACILRKKKNSFYNEEITLEEADSNDYSELYKALNELPADYRVTVVLYYIEGDSVKETAQILKVTEGTVKSRLSRGRKKLRGFLEEDYNE